MHWLFHSISEQEILTRVLKLEAACRNALEVGEVKFETNHLARAAKAAILDALGDSQSDPLLPIRYLWEISSDNEEREELYLQFRKGIV